MLIFSSTLLIVAASLERYFCSLYLHYTFSTKQRCSVIAIVLISAVIFKGCVFFELELQHLPECPLFSDLHLFPSSLTRSEIYRSLWMFWTRNVFTVVLPFTLLLFLNSRTISNLSKTTKDIDMLVEQLPSLLNGKDHVRARRRKRDATRTLAALVSIYLIANSLNMVITIMEFFDQASLMEMGDGWIYKYLADMSSLLTISSTASRLPVYFHCNHDMRTQIRQNLKRCHTRSQRIL